MKQYNIKEELGRIKSKMLEVVKLYPGTISTNITGNKGLVMTIKVEDIIDNLIPMFVEFAQTEVMNIINRILKDIFEPISIIANDKDDEADIAQILKKLMKARSLVNGTKFDDTLEISVTKTQLKGKTIVVDFLIGDTIMQESIHLEDLQSKDVIYAIMNRDFSDFKEKLKNIY